MFAALSGLHGVKPYPSQANMILARVPDAAATFAGMKARGVLIKNVSTMHALLDNCLRITIGTTDENRQCLAALRASL
jgi:histidinol-phosphate aminotransferase